MPTRLFTIRFLLRVLAALSICLLLPGNALRARAQTKNSYAKGGWDICRIPFTFDALLQPKIIIRVRINGSKPLPFWVDTGLNTGLLIDTQAARELGLTPDPDAPQTTFGAIRTRPVSLRRLTFPDAAPAGSVLAHSIKTALVGDLTLLEPESCRERIAGMIGIVPFLGSVAQLDFAAHRLSLFTRSGYPSLSSHAPVRPQAAVFRSGVFVLPMREDAKDRRYFVRLMLEKEVETELLVDTGAEGTGIPMSVAQHLHPAASRSAGIATVYGLSIMPTLLLPAVHLGGCPLNQAEINTMDETTAGFPLGVDLLSQFRVTLDFPRRLLLLERPPGRERSARVSGYTGVHLIRQRSRYVVAGVDDGGPAQRAGLRVGDTITGIDGQAPDSLSFLTVSRLLNGFAATRARLTLRRVDGQTNTLSFLRRSEFAGPQLPIDGLFLSKPIHKPVQIVGILPDCAGSRAGLRQGDVIVDFNGFPTREITPDTLAVEFRKPHLTLKVQRAGSEEAAFYTLTAKPD